MIALILAQAVAGPFLAPAPRPPSDAPCPPVVDTTDVVVCGRNDDRFRLRRLPPEVERPGLPKAETRIFGDARLAAETEQATLAGGIQSQRLMVRLKLPFGRAKKH